MNACGRCNIGVEGLFACPCESLKRRPSSIHPRVQRMHTFASTPNTREYDTRDEGPPLPSVGWLWAHKETAAARTRRRLVEENVRPKKSLGQNFLLDDGILDRIVKTAGIQEGDVVIEVGPGTGNLTRHLLAAGARVIAIEKDEKLYESLCKEFVNEQRCSRLRCIHGDALKQDMYALIERVPECEGQKVAIVANLPYNITKDALKEWLPMGSTKCTSLHLMLQHEVAERLTATDPQSRSDWRVMNILTQYYSTARYVFRIDRKKYHPVPQVDGALVAFELLAPEERVPVPHENSFITFVKKAFSQKRKMMKNSVQPLISGPDMVAALEACNLSPNARAQDLTLEQFAQLSRKLQ